MLEHPVVVEELREIAAAAVGDRGQDRRLGAEPLRGLEHREHRRPARAAGEDPLLPREAACGQERVAVGDAHVLVDDRRVEARRVGVLADPLDEIRVHRAAGVDRALRVGADDQQVGVLLLQVARDPGDRAARADADHHRVHLAAGLLPDLRAGRPVMGVSVALVGVLVGLVPAGDLLGEPVGDEVVALGGIRLDRRRTDHDFGAEGAQQRDLLGRDLVGDDEDHLVALDRRGEREADARVPGGRLDDRPAGPKGPSSSARASIERAIRSLLEPPGLRYSSFASRVGASSAPTF